MKQGGLPDHTDRGRHGKRCDDKGSMGSPFYRLPDYNHPLLHPV